MTGSKSQMEEKHTPEIAPREGVKNRKKFRSFHFLEKKNEECNVHNKRDMDHMFSSSMSDYASLKDNQKEVINGNVSKLYVRDLEIPNVRMKNKFQFVHVHGAENDSPNVRLHESSERGDVALPHDLSGASDRDRHSSSHGASHGASNGDSHNVSNNTNNNPSNGLSATRPSHHSAQDEDENASLRVDSSLPNASRRNEEHEENHSRGTAIGQEANGQSFDIVSGNIGEVGNVTVGSRPSENVTCENAPIENPPSENRLNGGTPPPNGENIETQTALLTSMENQNGNEAQNDPSRSRNSAENASNAEELDYYVLTIRDLRNTHVNESEYENEEELELSFYQRCFIGKLLGYEIKPNLEEYNLNKAIRLILFIFVMLALFSMEFALLYNNLLKVRILENQFLLIESNYNSTFINNFLFQFNDKELKTWHLTNDMIRDEISNGNFTLHNNLCEVANKLNVNCNDLLEFYKSNDKRNKEKIIENSIHLYDELSKRNMCIYRVKESLLNPCKDISSKTITGGSNYIFLFVSQKKHLKISKIFLILTVFFFCMRIALILSRILYDFVLFLCFKNYRLSIESKRKYLAKYMWSVSTILFLEIILGDDCVIWWLHDIDPIFNYHFQYFLWYISLFCLLTYVLHRVFRKYAVRNDSNNCSSASFSMHYVHDFLFGINIVFACLFILLNISKATVITIILTDIVLFIDILNDSYLEQIRLTNFEEFQSNRQRKKRFYIIENNKRNRKKFTLVRINEHIYQEVTLESNSEKRANENKGDFDTNNKGGLKKSSSKKNKIFNLKNIFNRGNLKNKKIPKNAISNGEEVEEGNGNNSQEENHSHVHGDKYDSIDNPRASSVEYCEICDERFKNVVLYPCMHGGFCETCIRSMIFNSLKLKDSFPNCPLCRDAIKNVYKISYEDSQQKVQAVTILTIRVKQ
ncbi:hypothetical protein C922_03183 [Plasmodium inui San Antonio 1]|uniref:RING-type domain-containing protein n=1 Tax=Plasmodium inui San Antonio 1 TaxID=1237626 RepID=W7ABV6_9APIC|nr:hypothetical protein C922_03183 [Plasmodium inui San Antonio 1]EUD66549.1 hypothetical protein C922_03183 [Plasmodium inui San Antonio 1]